MYKSILQDLFPCSLVCESDTDLVLAQWGNNSRIKFLRSLYPVICHCKSIVSVNQILRTCFALNPYWVFLYLYVHCELLLFRPHLNVKNFQEAKLQSVGNIREIICMPFFYYTVCKFAHSMH